jgi:hypothetical protein
VYFSSDKKKMQASYIATVVCPYNIHSSYYDFKIIRMNTMYTMSYSFLLAFTHGFDSK